MILRATNNRATRLNDDIPTHLAGLTFQYGMTVHISDPDLCLHCWQHQCVSVCPTASLTTRLDGRMSLDEQNCCGCIACMHVCSEFNNIAAAHSPDRV